MNILHDTLFQFIVTTSIALASLITTIIGLPKREPTQRPAKPPRKRTAKGCLRNSFIILIMLFGMLYFLFQILIASDGNLFPDTPIFIAICLLGLTLSPVVIILSLIRIIRGTEITTPLNQMQAQSENNSIYQQNQHEQNANNQ